MLSAVFAVTILILYVLNASRTHFNYWKKKNVKHDTPIPLFGNHLSILLGRRTFTETYSELYRKYDGEKYVGYYRGKVPELIIRDPDLLKNIFTTDFPHFHARGLGRDPKVEPLMLNIFSTDGDRWKILRHALTPAFTLSKLRRMFPLVTQCANSLQSVAEGLAEKEEDIDAYNLMARFSIDCIGVCGFGIKMNALNTERSLFFELGKIIFTISAWQRLLLALKDLFPGCGWINKIPYADNNVRKCILKIASIVREQRLDKTLPRRNDFMDLLLELESKTVISGDSHKDKDASALHQQVEIKFDEEYLAAQLYIFFAAGFETSSCATSFTLHQLACHQDIQQRIHKEIDVALKKYDGKLCYESVSEMPLLEMAFKESIRIFSPAGFVPRVCTERYRIPGTDLVLEAGTKIMIPLQALHMDPKFYDNPMEFKPERFSVDAMKSRHKYVYLPFGEGPRKCIGAHLGRLQSMAGMVAILQKFTVLPTLTSKHQHRVKRRAYLVQAVEGGLPIRLQLRK